MTKETFEKAKAFCEKMSMCQEVINALQDKNTCPCISIGLKNYPVDDSLRDYLLHYFRDFHKEALDEFTGL